MNFRLSARAALASAAFGLATLSVTPAFAQDQAGVKTGEDAAAQFRDFWTVEPSLEIDQENILLLDLSNGGRVAIRLKPQWAPTHVDRIKTLTRQGFYDGVIFHRVIEGFMAQTGDPTGTGMGGSELPDLTAEFNRVPHLRGSVAAAREGSNDDSANSQFFIVFYPTMQLDRKYTNFGRVIAGMQFVDQVQRGQPPANPTKILQASLASDHKAPPVTTPMTGKITSDMLSAPLPAGGDITTSPAGDEVAD
ncbi:peptidylprolyl isomerase [Croceicoccus ponticola]|uniref:Peptidyl-prolyl cis-trans isomerase n=1 Tax=Croceicoccus ponticola TaxID=2217664 RepID=A0A437H147_9SPHN|nr:peptidylprolyl isomerase [Croceicoccus ponticola]RVQ69232.1 peptidylprolyl isomerase [Croceicoccus ponticola]